MPDHLFVPKPVANLGEGMPSRAPVCPRWDDHAGCSAGCQLRAWSGSESEVQATVQPGCPWSSAGNQDVTMISL
jgi:hypothetical protein